LFQLLQDPATFLVALGQGRPFDQELEEVGKNKH